MTNETNPFGPSPFEGKEPASIQDKLDRQIETLPQEVVESTYNDAVKALEAHKAAPGEALKKVFGVLLSAVKL